MPALLLMCEHTMVLKSGLAQTRYKTRSGYITCCHASPFPVQQPRVLSLSSRFELFCDGLRVCDDCTSFRVHGKFLLVTTHRHTLRCLLLDFDLASECRLMQAGVLVRLKNGTLLNVVVQVSLHHNCDNIWLVCHLHH